MRKIFTLFTMLILSGVLVFAQSRVVTGTVTDDKGVPIENATVRVKGSRSGVAADANGNFRISVSPGATLIFSGVGITAKEIAVLNQSTIDVSLVRSGTELTGVVVTALGIRREKKGLSSAVSEVKSDQLVQKSEPDILRSLEGKVPGVNITSGGGAPGQSTKINIRGITSFSGNNQPIIVVDGIPFDNSVNASVGLDQNTVFSNRLYDIDPNNVESITVLKGANAAALYGSGAQNGAIVITTKTGTKIKNKGLEVTYNVSYSTEKVSDLPDYQDVYGQGSNQNYNGGFIGNWGAPFGFQRDMLNKQLGYDRYTPTNAPDSVPHPLYYSSYAIPRFRTVFPELKDVNVFYGPHDIVGGFFQRGHVVENSLNVNSSQGKTGLNAGVSRMTNTGIIPNSNAARTSLTFGGSSTLANGLTVSGNVNYVRTEQQSPQSGASYFNDYGPGEGNSSIYARLFYLPRNFNLNEYPFETPDGRNVFYRSLDNPRWIAKYNLFNSTVDRAFGGLTFNYDPFKWLNLTARGGVNTYTDHQTNFIRPGGTAVNEGRFWEADFLNQSLNLTYLATIKQKLTTDLDLRASVGADYIQRYNRGSRNTGLGIIDPNLKTLRNTQSVLSNFDYSERTRKIGALGEVQFSYKNYLFLNFTGRNDWTSTLPMGKNSYFFPSAGIGFVFTEALGIGKKIINYGKLRLSAAKVAREPGAYQLLTTYSINPQGGAYTTNGGGVFNYAALSNQVKNPDLKPEITKEIEAGLEMQFLNNRIGFDLTVFKKNSTDQIISVSSPASSGFTTRVVNAGEIENKGIELGLTVTPVRSKNFNWTSTFNFNLLRSKVIDAGPTGEIFLGGSGYSSLGTIIRTGQPFGMIYGSKNARDSATGAVLIDETTGTPIPLPESKIIGNPAPDFTLNVNNSFSFKGLTLGFLIDWRQGGDMFSITAASLLLRGQLNNPYGVDREGIRIIPGVYGDPQTYQAILDSKGAPIKNTTGVSAFDSHFSNGFGAYGADETNVYDVTTIRLREVTLGYEIPKTLLKKTFFGSARLSVSARNLWFKAPNMLKGLNFDPEVLAGNSLSNVQGFDFGASPSTKRYGINLSVTF
jgi:TonB-linked SusC/RagA family outer membrane protein